MITTLNLTHHKCSLDDTDRQAPNHHHPNSTGNPTVYDGSEHSFDQCSTGQRDEDSFSTNSNMPRGNNLIKTDASLSNKSMRAKHISKRSLIENLNLVHTNGSNTTTDVSSPRGKPPGSVFNFMGDKPKASRIKLSGRRKFAISLSSLFRTQNRIKKFRK